MLGFLILICFSTVAFGAEGPKIGEEVPAGLFAKLKALSGQVKAGDVVAYKKSGTDNCLYGEFINKFEHAGSDGSAMIQIKTGENRGFFVPEADVKSSEEQKD